jgi:hypothetical protein
MSASSASTSSELSPAEKAASGIRWVVDMECIY